MRKILPVFLCVVVLILSFFYFLPADLLLVNYLAASSVNCSSVEGNGWHLRLSDLEYKGISVNSINVVNRIVSLIISSGRSRIDVHPFSKRADFSLVRFPFSINTYGLRAESHLDLKGFINSNLTGDLKGKVDLSNAIYKGIKIGKLEGRFSYKDGNFSSDFTSPSVKGRITGRLRKFKGKIVAEGVADLFVAGQHFSERFNYELAGLR